VFSTARRVSDLETRIAALALAVAELRQDLKSISHAGLKSRIDELEADIESHRASVKSQFGRLYHRERLSPTNGSVDPELDALIAHQNAPAVPAK
jgi:outer membrane murein-binding lipoprotein Lpp